MSDVSWIKITTTMFEDEKIDYIGTMPDADSIIVIWIRLLTMAGRCNAGGYIFLTERIPYTEEMLAHKFKKPGNTIKLALRLFQELGMISFDESNRIRITNWDKHQNVTGLDKIRELNRARQERHRQKVKQIAGGNDDVTQGNVTVTPEITGGNGTDKDKEEDKDKDINKALRPENIGTDKPKPKYKFEPVHMELAERLRTLILDNKPNRKLTSDVEQWANTFRLMMERDEGRTYELVSAVLEWSQQDPFWKKNILSADTFREKFDRLEDEMNDNLAKKRPTQPTGFGRMTGAVDGCKSFLARHGGGNRDAANGRADGFIADK